jgi:hypothetical protein
MLNKSRVEKKRREALQKNTFAKLNVAEFLLSTKRPTYGTLSF